MKAMHEAASKSIVRTASWMALLGTILAMNISFVAKASAESGAAEKLLKGMADYVTSQKTIAVTFDSDIEVITSNLQKIQFTSSGQVQLSRPDKLRATRTGGYRDVEIVFDGKTLTVNNKDGKDYAQIEAPGTAEELIDVLREKHGVVAPGADLLLSNVFNVLMTDVVEAAVIGKGVIDGVECDHLAFRNVETDWQIWIESSAKPIPRKYVITSKTYADRDGYIDVQKLTCAQLANTFQEDADYLTVWYSGWYNGLGKKHMMQVDRAKSLEHQVIVHCKANPDKKVIEAIDVVFKTYRTEKGIKMKQ